MIANDDDIMTKRASIPPAVLLRELDGESVLLNLDSECYYGLDEVGTQIWKVVTSSGTIVAAYETLAAEYDVAPEVLAADMRSLLKDLVAHGLLAVSDA
jgi:hypothetical protein